MVSVRSWRRSGNIICPISHKKTEIYENLNFILQIICKVASIVITILSVFEMVSFSRRIAVFSRVQLHEGFCVCHKLCRFRKENIMQDVIKEYGPAVITVIAIGAMIILVKALIGTDATGLVGSSFKTLLETMLSITPTT
jgi:hypothetical protein